MANWAWPEIIDEIPRRRGPHGRPRLGRELCWLTTLFALISIAAECALWELASRWIAPLCWCGGARGAAHGLRVGSDCHCMAWRSCRGYAPAWESGVLTVHLLALINGGRCWPGTVLRRYRQQMMMSPPTPMAYQAPCQHVSSSAASMLTAEVITMAVHQGPACRLFAQLRHNKGRSAQSLQGGSQVTIDILNPIMGQNTVVLFCVTRIISYIVSGHRTSVDGNRNYNSRGRLHPNKQNGPASGPGRCTGVDQNLERIRLYVVGKSFRQHTRFATSS